MDGIVIINKPKNCTSHDIVQKVKKQLNEKVGHTGTLDPMATGVLPLLIGKGTLCSKYLVNHDKIYQAQLTLGKKTDTADSEGNVIENVQVSQEIFKTEKIEQVLKTFIGKQNQVPPMYSAIKINGKKLYEYARNGQTVEIKPRNIEIYDIKLLKIEKTAKTIEFQVHCSKGTYIRSLCEDIAKQLGTVGYMSGLNRIKVGEFSIKQAISVEDLQNGNFDYIPIEDLFKDKNEIFLTEKKLNLFLNGVMLSVDNPEDVYKIYCKKQFVGTGVVKNRITKT